MGGQIGLSSGKNVGASKNIFLKGFLQFFLDFKPTSLSRVSLKQENYHGKGNLISLRHADTYELGSFAKGYRSSLYGRNDNQCNKNHTNPLGQTVPSYPQLQKNWELSTRWLKAKYVACLKFNHILLA